MKKTLLLTAILLLAGFSHESGAVSIDFRDSAFSSANGQSSFYYSPEGLTISALPNGARLFWDSNPDLDFRDGFGVNSYSSSSTYEWDEIEGVELLHLHFDSPRLLNEILITDLFYEPSNDTGSSQYWYREKGWYSFDPTNITRYDIEADLGQTPSPATNGELLISFSSAPEITDIWFSAPGWENYKREDHEFSVARVDVADATRVPEPATILLIGSGLIVLSQIRRRMK